MMAPNFRRPVSYFSLSILILTGVPVILRLANFVPAPRLVRFPRKLSPMYAKWPALASSNMAESFDPDVSKEHYKQYERRDMKYGSKDYRVPVTAVVTPKDCSRCHPDEAKQYARSKHANTLYVIWQIDPWLNKGMNSDFERASGCFPLPRHSRQEDQRR